MITSSRPNNLRTCWLVGFAILMPWPQKIQIIFIESKEEILRDFLVKSLTLDWARSQNIVISEGMLDKEVDTLRANYPDDLSFRRALAQENMSFSEWREDLRYGLAEKEVFKN